MRVLITGASGLLGSSLCLSLSQAGHDVTGTVLTHGGPFPFTALRVDLREKQQVRELFTKVQPECVVHCAALSRVIECERQPLLAWQHNVEATRILSEQSKQFGSHFIFLSTDQVFDGQSRNHVETDCPTPTHVYGKSKAEGEEIVCELCPSFLILRSNNIVGRSLGFGQSFTDGILQKLLAGEHVELFHDQIRSPIHLRVMTKLVERAIVSRLTGVLHAGGPEHLSRFGTGCLLADAYGVSRTHLLQVSLRTHPDAEFLHKDGTFNTAKFKSLYPDLASQLIRVGFDIDARSNRVTANA